ncbi:MAG TPA: ABC transporter substrate-binding protein [Thermodesulfobacteriota bacterium]|nr:ABC transporter substrate-binding protein [Thermodesulfobacteriota bacterium]
MKGKSFQVGIILLAVLAGTAFSGVAFSQPKELPLVRASHQPCMHALPTILATDFGWWDEIGIKVSFHYFVSGMPQVEAGQAGEWDVGAIGTVPCLFAGIKYQQPLIAISNDESVTNNLMVRPEAFNTWLKDPKRDLKGKTFLVSTISTGHYAVVAYLKKIGLTENDVKIVHMEQSAILSAFLSGQGDVAQTWAPFNYMMEEKGMKVLSHGKDAGVVIPGGVVATKKFAEEKPELVAKWLEGYMRGIDFMIDNPREAAKHLGKYYREKCGINLSDEVCLKEFELRPLFRTKQQIKMYERKGGKMSTVDKWMDDLAQYFVEVKKIDQKPDPKTYINDKFLKMVDKKSKK